MVGKLLYTNPLVSPSDYDLPYCADWSMGVWRGVQRWEAGTLDRLLEAAMRNDFMEVTTIRFICTSHHVTPRHTISHPLQCRLQ